MYIFKYSVLQLAVSGAKNTRQFASTKSKQRSTAPQHPIPDGMQHPVSAKVDHRNTVPHKTTVGGVPYALSTKVSVQGNNTSRDNTKNRKVHTNVSLNPLASCVLTTLP